MVRFSFTFEEHSITLSNMEKYYKLTKHGKLTFLLIAMDVTDICFSLVWGK